MPCQAHPHVYLQLAQLRVDRSAREQHNRVRGGGIRHLKRRVTRESIRVVMHRRFEYFN
jgi:hypothetical protein